MIFVVFSSVQTLADEVPTLDLFSEHNPPLATYDPDTGDLSGTNIEVTKELMRRSGVPYRLRYLPFKRAYRHAQEVPNSCLVGAIVTEEREKLFALVKPMMTGGWAIFKRADSEIELAGLADALPFSIGVTDGYPATEFLKTKGDFRFMPVPDSSSQIEMLINGRVDLALSGINFVRQFKVPDTMSRPVVALMVRPVEVGLACHKETSPEILSRLRAHLEGLQPFADKILSPKAGTK